MAISKNLNKTEERHENGRRTTLVVFYSRFDDVSSFVARDDDKSGRSHHHVQFWVEDSKLVGAYKAHKLGKVQNPFSIIVNHIVENINF